VKNVLAELSAPLALVKRTAGRLCTTPRIQVLGPNAHRVAVVFINPARLLSRSRLAPEEPEIGGAAIVLPPGLGAKRPSLMSARERPGRLSLTAMPTPTSLCGRSCDEKARAPPLPSRCSGTLRRSRRAVDPETEIALSRTGRTTMPPRRRRTPVRVERDWRWRWRPAERQHGSGWPDQQRPSGRVIPRPGRRQSAGAIYVPPVR
jgi:hypothetical protein